MTENYDQKISELYFMIFGEKPDSSTLAFLLETFQLNNNSLNFIENHLRHSEKFKILSKKLEIELEISELYYVLLNRKPDQNGISFFRDEILNHGKTIDWVKKSIEDSDEYVKKLKSDSLNKLQS